MTVRSDKRPSWWRAGAPMIVLVIAILVALASVIVTASRSGNPDVRGYAEFQAERGACFVVPGHSLNVTQCRYISPTVYELVFSRDIAESVPIATRASCCPGPIVASISGPRRVVISLSEEDAYPVRAQVVVP